MEFLAPIDDDEEEDDPDYNSEVEEEDEEDDDDDDPMNIRDRMSELERQRSIQDTQVKYNKSVIYSTSFRPKNFISMKI
jgi:hypothetical protein